MNPSQNVDIHCPYCGESIELVVDCSVGSQDYVEDCQVCCRPMHLSITIDMNGDANVVPRREDD